MGISLSSPWMPWLLLKHCFPAQDAASWDPKALRGEADPGLVCFHCTRGAPTLHFDTLAFDLLMSPMTRGEQVIQLAALSPPLQGLSITSCLQAGSDPSRAIHCPCAPISFPSPHAKVSSLIFQSKTIQTNWRKWTI